jgi:biofilm PGA synthesis N-glycosyltransferase PgaC
MLLETISPIILLIATAGYLVLILLFTTGWVSITDFNKNHLPAKTFISVLLPVRNEENNIESCLRSVLNQTLSKNHYEIILIDDYSDDGTIQKAEKFNKENTNFYQKSLKQHGIKPGKKNAISFGVTQAKGELIITVDADCIYDKEWLNRILSFYQVEKPHMIICPVALKTEKGILNRFQELEFASLQASGAGAAILGFPFMCNGANLAFSKKVFQIVNGYAGNEDLPSGDDVFLLHKIIKQFGNKGVKYLKSKEAIAIAEGTNDLTSFYKQRIRWASKAKKYRNFSAIITSIIVFSFSFLMLASLFLGFYNKSYLIITGFMLLTKIVIDFPLLYSFNRFLKRTNLMIYYLPLQMVYPFYITITGISSVLSKNKWDKA